ncbi:hypothetical protein BT96DRAFT_927671 [Gymnopus androsaceus JB14]|uniref:Uncharacterized protein n=1 Tax=Gymnopus androsaceus JB14 TaxID=1447944 RepID=A0A6A4GQ92_9AGAR|nr:hypothetical protein BT96DRAFT_927671 [Gymnopus androsaceus JB14]
MYRYNSYRNIHRERGFVYRKSYSSAGKWKTPGHVPSTRLYFLLFPLSLRVTGVLTELGGNKQMLEVEDRSIDVTEAIIEANPVLVC